MTKPKKPHIPEDSSIFREAMRSVKPLVHTKISLQQKPTSSLSQSKPVREPPASYFQFSDYETLDPVKSDDFLKFARPGVQPKILRKMRQGQYNAEAILDLHGKTIDEARESLGEFLLQCQQDGSRHILIIHGKGRHNNAPILKNKLNHWLRQTEQIIAFCTATPRNGGSGALYVLLRREH